MTTRLLSADQVAARLDVCVDTVQRWCRRGRFPGAVNFHGSAGWRIPETALDRLGGRRPPNRQPSKLSKSQQREART